MYEKTVKVIVVCIFIGIFFISCSRSCSEQNIAREYGGEMDVDLEPNRKLVEITWKGSNLWYLTKAMGPDDIAEDYIFQEKDVTGWMEGAVIIHEYKMNEEEYQEYLEKKNFENDYYREGNFIYDEYTGDNKEVFISCDPVTGEYKKLKDYTVTEDGSLIAK